MINGKPVSSEKQAAVLRAIDELGYYASDVARSLIKKESRLVGVIVPDILNQMTSHLLEELEGRLSGSGYRLFLASTRRVDTRARRLIELFLEQRVAGVILPLLTGAAPIVSELIAHHVPVVLVGEGELDSLCSCVMTDGRKGSALATQHCLELGHERIAFIRGVERSLASREREQGYAAALDAAGLALLDHQIQDGQFTYDGGRAAGHRLLARAPYPTAIVCANDMMAFGALDAAAERQVVVPRDLSIVGFDDVPMASWRRWGLTTVRQPAASMAQAAVEALMAEIARARMGQQLSEKRMFEPELIVRSTTGPRRGSSRRGRSPA